MEKMNKWSAQFTNDPARGYELCLELLEDYGSGGKVHGHVERDLDGDLYLRLYGS